MFFVKMVAGVKLKITSSPQCVVYLLVFLPLLISAASHGCSYIPPNPEDVLNPVHLEQAHIVRKRSISQPLRIRVIYDASVYGLPEEKFVIINDTILPSALAYWERTLNVRPTKVPIRLNRKCKNNQAFSRDHEPHLYCNEYCEKVTSCGEVVVPEEHLEPCRTCDRTGRLCRTVKGTMGPGIANADFVFYISAMQTHRCFKGQTVAYAAHCQQEAATDRPVAGHANLCPDSISTKPQDMDTLLSTVKHEILHALGFSVSLYAYFRDSNGYPLTPRERSGKPSVNKELQTHKWSDRVMRRIVRHNWKIRGRTVPKTSWMMVTPRVVEEVRRHFNCSYLEGAEMEDQGEDGTKLTHWEKRLFENEAMTGTHTQNPVYSRITLALMEDTGWYIPNYEQAQLLEWGHNLGCDFATKSCKEWIDNRRARGQSIHPYCDKVKKDPLETECTDSRDSVALCNLMKHEEQIDDMFLNFDYIPGVPSANLSWYGGSVVLADYCPYIQSFSSDLIQAQYKPASNASLIAKAAKSQLHNSHNHQPQESTVQDGRPSHFFEKHGSSPSPGLPRPFSPTE
ncbi:leishmanolysin-like peptidase isoform X2 [Ornithodoros turicata]|uniref:leishmanolysin-like peptidase isoform X2 n=1 Tax=Ornithodoros turicata TaxID=34597 RepID=UPI00313A371A